jgi:hypothetical protein
MGQTTEEETYLTIAEFATQPEVDKHPSQIYGWLKRGLPVKEIDGKKHIPFEAGLDWVRARAEMSARKKRELAISIVDRPSVGTSRAFIPVVEPGTFLRWSRGTDQGPAYGLVQYETNSLLCIAVEYRAAPVYLSKAGVERDIAKGVVNVVHPTEVISFLLTELARLDFLAHIRLGVEEARKLKRIILSSNVVDPDLVERFRENYLRSPKGWPKDEDLEEEPTDDDSTTD